MKRTKVEAVSSIQQTVLKEMKAIREEAFSRAFDSLYEYERCMSEVNFVRKRAGTTLNDGVNTYFLSFYDLSSGTCHTVYSS
jgi:hypothetical protein